MTDLVKRRGQFYLDFTLVEQEPERAALVLAGVVVIRAEALYHQHAIHYVGFHPAFDAPDDGAIMPEYQARITETKGGLKVSWERAA